MLLSLAFAVPAAVRGADAAATLRYDHYNPVVLNEYALQKIREGDLGTAAILLERAVQLAPHEERIRQNLAALRAWQNGRPAAAATVKEMKEMPEAKDAQVMSTDAGMPTFPLWPKR